VRKRPAEAPPASRQRPYRPKKQKAAPPPDPSIPPPGPSRFLALPAKLRNEIYGYIGADVSSAFIHRRARGKLLTVSPLTSVSKQVADEYQAILYITVPKVIASVKDFNFSHIVAFLNKLSDAEVNALPDLVASPGERQIVAQLEVTKSCSHNPETLHRWLTRCEHPTKKGIQLDLSYSATGDPPDWIDYGPMGSKKESNASHVRTTLKKKLKEVGKAEKGRMYQELEEIVAALEPLE